MTETPAAAAPGTGPPRAAIADARAYLDRPASARDRADADRLVARLADHLDHALAVNAVDDELRALYERDQADRQGGELTDETVERDAARLARVRELLAAGAVRGATARFHAAMVFQHGPDRQDAMTAHELAVQAAEAGHPVARWLAAAALDRWLVRGGEPQRYGTQYTLERTDEGERWVLYPVDPATTDEERAAWDVPSLAEAERMAARLGPP